MSRIRAQKSNRCLILEEKKKKEVEFLCWKEIITERFKAFYLCWQVQDQRCLRWLKMHFRVISHSFSRLSLQAAANSGWWLYPHYNQMWMRSGPWGVSEHRPLWSWSTISASALILFFFFLCLPLSHCGWINAIDLCDPPFTQPSVPLCWWQSAIYKMETWKECAAYIGHKVLKYTPV